MGMECQKVMALTALDFSAAFDTVYHQILFEVLKALFGTDDHVLNWFKTYLAPRKFVVDVEGHKSKEKDMQFSVPQRSLAGTVLYLAYVSTIQYAINISLTSDSCNNPFISVNGYADDHSVKKSFKANSRDEEKNTMVALETCMDQLRMDGYQ